MARSFNGSSDAIGLVDAHVSNPGVAFSVAMWIKAASGATNREHYSEGLNGNANPFLQWFVTTADKSNVAVRADGGGASDQLTGAATVADGSWHHVCITQTTGNLITQYVDGVSDATLTRTSNSNGTTTLDRASFGDFVTSSTTFFNGSIGRAASWARTLSAQEVKSLASGMDPMHLAPKHYWPLWGVDSPEPDIGTGPHVSGTLTGTSGIAGPPVGLSTFSLTDHWFPQPAAPAPQTLNVGFISAGTTLYALSLVSAIPAPFISAATTLYALTLSGSGTASLTVPKITATAVAYAPTLQLPPLFVAAISASGSAVFVYYNNSLDESVDPDASQFTVTVNGVGDTVTDVFVVGNSAVLALATAIPDGATVTVAYTPGTNQVTDIDANLAPAFTGSVHTVALFASPAGVSIAFTDNILDPTPDWTRLDDTPNLVASFSIDRGRSFELDRTDVGRATVVINDIDGVLDPTNSSGPYYGLIEPLLPIALSLHNPVTDEWSMLYRGYIEDLSYEEHPSQRVNFLTITCVDAEAILTAIEMQPGSFGDALPPTVGTLDYTGNIFFDDAEKVNLRMIQVLGAANAGWPTALTTIFSGNVSLLETVYAPGENVMQVLQDCADAEFPGLGNVYVSRDGKVTFHGRKAKFDPEGVSGDAGAAWDWHHWKAGDGPAVNASPTDTAHIRELSFNRGLSKVINSALASPKDIDSADIAGQLVQDPASIGTYGIRSWSAESLLTGGGTDDGLDANEETRLFAEYYVNNYAEPRNRIDHITFRAIQPTSIGAQANWNLLCGAEISDQIDVTVTHPGGGGFNLEPFFIEGIHYDVRPANPEYPDVTLTLDLSPAAYFAQNPFS